MTTPSAPNRNFRLERLYAWVVLFDGFGRASLSGIKKLESTLRATIATLKALRKAVSDAGQIQAMQDIDTLLHVAQIEAEKTLTNLRN